MRKREAKTWPTTTKVKPNATPVLLSIWSKVLAWAAISSLSNLNLNSYACSVKVSVLLLSCVISKTPEYLRLLENQESCCERSYLRRGRVCYRLQSPRLDLELAYFVFLDFAA